MLPSHPSLAGALRALLCSLCLVLPVQAAELPTAADQPAAAASPAAPTPVPRRPLAHFARLPHLARVTLSPDGRRIAALVNQPNRTVLITRASSGSGAPQPVLDTDNLKFQFNWMHWVNNERLLVSLRYPGRRGFVGTVETRLFSIKADGGELLSLQRNETSSGLGIAGRSQQIQDDVIDWLPGDGKHVLLQQSEPGSPLPAVVELNVETGARRIVKSPERNVHGWLTDAQHRVRVGVRDNLEGRREIIERGPDGGAWRTLWTFERAADAVWPLGFGTDPQALYVRASHEGRMAVFVVRLDDPKLPRQLLLSGPEQDVDGSLLVAPGTGEVLGLRGAAVGVGEARADLWSPTWRSQLKGIDQALPGMHAQLLDLSHDQKRYLVYASGNGRPGAYYLGDRSSGEIVIVGDTYPDLAQAKLVGKHAVRLKARDGLPMRAYLTLPQGREPGDGHGRLPLVLLPHGGPHSRDDDDFDPWTEFLANRGLAVLQVNFRGSEGYGHAFEEAGLKRWGLEMQDDLTDAVAWAVAHGVADAGRVCIVGASYGGYAALMGAVKTPEAYRCAVSFAGVTDLPDLIAHQGDYIGGDQAMEAMIGRVWGDRARLRATSPALQAERIRAPVLLVHGTSDRVVPVGQSQGMARALRRAGKSVRYVEQEGGDHHLGRYEHRIAFFTELEAFLDQHLQPHRAP